jgi:hypothetical protein
MNKEQQQIIDEAYELYLNETKIYHYSDSLILSKEEFINKIKTDPEFSETCGIKIEERELTPKERIELAGGRIQDKYPALVEMSLIVCDERDIPNKLITLTYNNETIESYDLDIQG